MAIAAAEAGVVEVSAAGFKCTACAVTLSGVAPLEEHLVSNNHKKRVDQDKVTKPMLRIIFDAEQRRLLTRFSKRFIRVHVC